MIEIITREEARERGLKRYFTGRPCKRGHLEERATSNSTCLGCKRVQSSNHRRDTPDYYVRYNKYVAEWRTKNREHFLEYCRRRKKERYHADTQFRLKEILRSRFRSALKGATEHESALQLVGCSTQELREWLEDQFGEGMTWDNYGEWHIDHIIPCSAFELQHSEEQEVCFHYTNLRPMWAEDNIRKSDKLIF